jgi:hypothetical protein
MVTDKFGLNRCNNYIIGCPYALAVWNELPCIVPNQEACDKWREKYEREEPEAYKEATELKEKLAKVQEHLRMQELERMLDSCYK